MLSLLVAIYSFSKKNRQIHSIKLLDAFVCWYWGIGETVVKEPGIFSVLVTLFLVRKR